MDPTLGDSSLAGRAARAARGCRRGPAWWLALILAAAAPGAARGEGVVGEATTTSLLNALLGGGLVQLTYSGTLTVEVPLIIAADTILEGAGPGGRDVTLSGGGSFRLLQVLPGIRLEIRNCILREGQSTNGGAIYNAGVLVASNATFVACEAVGADGAPGGDGQDGFGIAGNGGDGQAGNQGRGGAVFNLGEAAFIDCLFSGNRAIGGTGGAGGTGGQGTVLNGRGGDGGLGGSAYGGAVASEGAIRFLRCQFVSNSAEGGDGGSGGASATGGGSERAGQGAAGAFAAGGALHCLGSLLVEDSTFATNLVTGGTAANAGAPFVNIGNDGPPGGSAYGGAIASWSRAAIINTTFYTNLVAGGSGGNGAAGTFIAGNGGAAGSALGAALHLRGEAGITNVTFVANAGAAGGPGSAGEGGFGRDGDAGIASGSAIATDAGPGPVVVNSILSTVAMPTTYGPVMNAGHNLFSDGATGQGADGTYYGTDPVLSGYQVWGQGLPGFLPLLGSPAIDGADADAAPATDQRGLSRAVGLGPDIGALESSASSYSILGRVLAGLTGVPGVRLQVGAREAVTDEHGEFAFRSLNAGFYTVELENAGLGYVPRLIQIPLAGADATNVVFRATSTAIAHARDPATGELVFSAAGVAGRIYRLEGGHGLRQWQTVASATADASGQVTLRVTPGPDSPWFYRLAWP